MKSVASVLFVSALLTAACRNSSPSSPTPPLSDVTVPSTLPQGVTSAMVLAGQATFRGGTCPICHSTNAKGVNTRGPDLTDSVFLHNSGFYEEIIAIITSGVPAQNLRSPTTSPQFFMQPKGAMGLTDDQLRSLAAYVWALSHPQGCNSTPC